MTRPSHEEKRQIFEHNFLFGELSSDEIDTLIHFARTVSYSAGEEIYAKVPFRINQNHPIRVRGRSYLPITIAYSRPQMEQGIVVEDYLVHYVRLDDLGNV